jgi:hypothetical protein
LTIVVLAIEIIVSLVIMFLTSHLSVSDDVQITTSIPISIISCLAGW